MNVSEGNTSENKPHTTVSLCLPFLSLRILNPISMEGLCDSYPSWLTVFDNKVFFTAVDNSGELELWATDGTEIGTNLISNLAGSMSGDPHELTAGRYSLTYSAFTVQRGRELWYTTQSPYSTGPLEDINLGSSSSSPKNIIYWYDAPVFSAKDNNCLRYLWRSDVSLEKISTDHILPTESLVTVFNNDIYFVANYQGEGDASWKYDGNMFTEIFDNHPETSEDTVVKEIKQSGDLLYFAVGSSSSNGLYSTDGTPENTILIESGESTGMAYSGADNLIDVDGTLYFAATASYGKDLWKIDDSNAKAIIVDPLNRERGINRADHLTLVGDKIFYEGAYSFDSELWLYNVSQQETRIVKEINTEGDSLERIDNTFTPFGDRLLFVARDPVHGEELWVTNGNESGTYRLTDLMDGEADSEIDEITVLHDKVIFKSNSDDFGKELFVWNSSLDSGVSSPSIPGAEQAQEPQPEPLPELEPEPGAEQAQKPYDGIIESVIGKGKLKGTNVADAFTFDSFDTFSKRSADAIIRFDASEGDTIAVSPSAFPALKGTSEINFAFTNKKKELKQLSKQDYDFVYYEKKGRLYFDGNGPDKNWGDSNEGGLVAILKGKPELTAEDFTLLA